MNSRNYPSTIDVWGSLPLSMLYHDIDSFLTELVILERV